MLDKCRTDGPVNLFHALLGSQVSQHGRSRVKKSGSRARRASLFDLRFAPFTPCVEVEKKHTCTGGKEVRGNDWVLMTMDARTVAVSAFLGDAALPTSALKGARRGTFAVLRRPCWASRAWVALLRLPKIGFGRCGENGVARSPKSGHRMGRMRRRRRSQPFVGGRREERRIARDAARKWAPMMPRSSNRGRLAFWNS